MAERPALVDELRQKLVRSRKPGNACPGRCPHTRQRTGHQTRDTAAERSEEPIGRGVGRRRMLGSQRGHGGDEDGEVERALRSDPSHPNRVLWSFVPSVRTQLTTAGQAMACERLRRNSPARALPVVALDAMGGACTGKRPSRKSESRRARYSRCAPGREGAGRSPRRVCAPARPGLPRAPGSAGPPQGHQFEDLGRVDVLRAGRVIEQTKQEMAGRHFLHHGVVRQIADPFPHPASRYLRSRAVRSRRCGPRSANEAGGPARVTLRAAAEPRRAAPPDWSADMVPRR